MAVEPAVDNYLNRPLQALFDTVASKDSVPAAGSVIAAMGALAAGLAEKVAHRSTSRLPDSEGTAHRANELRGKLETFITADAIGYASALAMRGQDRAAAMVALSSELTLMVEAAAEIAELASALVGNGNPNLRFDADAAARIAVTVAEIGAELIRANVGESDLLARAHSAVGRARAAARETIG